MGNEMENVNEIVVACWRSCPGIWLKEVDENYRKPQDVWWIDQRKFPEINFLALPLHQPAGCNNDLHVMCTEGRSKVSKWAVSFTASLGKEVAVDPYSYMGGRELKCRPGAGYSGWGYSWFSSVSANAGYYLKLDRDRFLPPLFQFMDPSLSHHLTQYNFSCWNTRKNPSKCA